MRVVKASLMVRFPAGSPQEAGLHETRNKETVKFLIVKLFGRGE